MARPIKQGIDYFPFDVDFFSDEKLYAISGEFGIKGEITTIKLLCAVYRNGYYIEWTEMLKFKLLKELPGVSADLLEQIIRRLVKWDFFDKGLFDSASILTSRGIQRRFQTISTKMHRKNIISEYCLLDIPQPATKPDAAASVTAKAQKRVVPPAPPKVSASAPVQANTSPVHIDESAAIMLSDTNWNEPVCIRYSLSREAFEARIKEFRNYCMCLDKQTHEDISDAKRHFCAWLNSGASKRKEAQPPKEHEVPQKEIPTPEERQEELQKERFLKLVPCDSPGHLIMSIAQFQALGLDRMSDEKVRRYCAEVLSGKRKVPPITELLKQAHNNSFTPSE